jgi:ribosomal protein L37AE/L43A
MTTGQGPDPLAASAASGQAASGNDGGGERQIPFFCPYCGEEDLFPAGSTAGGWTCRSCARSFTLRFAGLSRTQAAR